VLAQADLSLSRARLWRADLDRAGGHHPPRAVLTERARAEACRRVGKDAHSVAAVARDLGVGWATVMRAVRDHGRPLVEDPTRLDGVAALGLDETSFLKATRTAPTRYVTGLVDLERGRLLDLVADRTRAAVAGWLGARPHSWLARVGTVSLDPWRGYASALVAPLGHAIVVVDHFHAVRLANMVVDQTRRRVQQATLGHRGRSTTRYTGSASSCSWPQSSSPSQDKRACALGWPPGIRPARWPRPGRARSCSGTSTPWSACRLPEPPLCASTAGQTVSKCGAVAPGPHRAGLGGQDPRLACHRGLFQRAHRGGEPAHQEGQVRRARLPQFRQLSPAAATALRRHVADPSNRRAARPLPTLDASSP
jgi:hypothetical protein